METEEEKQHYLRSTILDKGYDGEKFMNFLSTKKNGEIDLSYWSLAELQEVTSEFISLSQPETPENIPQQPQIPENDPQQPQNDNPIDNPSTTPLQNSNSALESAPTPSEKVPPSTEKVNEQTSTSSPQSVNSICPLRPYFHRVATKVSPKTALSDIDKISITVSKPWKVEGGVFTKAYNTFLVETFPLNYSVRRRNSDFDWLRDILEKLYIGCVIPDLPKKNFGVDKSDPKFLNKRSVILNNFINEIISHPLLKNSKIVFDFLTTSDDKAFSAKKEEYEKLNPPTTIKDIKSINGEINVEINKNKEIYFSSIKEDINQNFDLCQKLIDSLKKLFDSLKDVSEKIKDISNVWDAFLKNSQKYKDRETTINLYKNMKMLFTKWSDSNLTQINYLSNSFKNFFSYLKSEYSSFGEYVKKIDDNKDDYYSSENKLLNKKKETFKKKDYNSWGLDFSHSIEKKKLNDMNYALTEMYAKETQEVLQLKEFYGYYLNMAIEEYERLRDLNMNRIKDNILNFCEKNGLILFDLYSGHRDINKMFGSSVAIEDENKKE